MKNNEDIDINKATPELKEKILNFIKEDHSEDDHLDYKQKWESTDSELLKDIFSFTNTVHNKDCYLVYGVTDKNHDIIGVNGSKDRRDQKNITDFLNNLHIAGDYVPPINVSTITLINGKQIDVLTVKNNFNVPVYLASKYIPKKGKGAPINPGLIFSRIGSKNTGRNEITNYSRVEALWKKHLGIGLPIKKRYINVLKDINNWKYYDMILPGSKPRFIYELDPRFTIKILDDKDANRKSSPISLSLMSDDYIPGWFYLDLEYNHNTIDSQYGHYLDDCHSMVISPNVEFRDPMKNILSLNFMKDSMRYCLNRMISNAYINSFFQNEPRQERYSHIMHYQKSLNSIIILFDSKSEKNKFYKWFNDTYSDADLEKEISKISKPFISGTTYTHSINKKGELETEGRNYASSKIYKQAFEKWRENRKY